MSFKFEHNWALTLLNYITPFCNPDSNIAQQFACTRIKGIGIVLNVFKNISLRNLVNDLQGCPSSLNIDETTDMAEKSRLQLWPYTVKAVWTKTDRFAILL